MHLDGGSIIPRALIQRKAVKRGFAYHTNRGFSVGMLLEFLWFFPEIVSLRMEIIGTYRHIPMAMNLFSGLHATQVKRLRIIIPGQLSSVGSQLFADVFHFPSMYTITALDLHLPRKSRRLGRYEQMPMVDIRRLHNLKQLVLRGVTNWNMCDLSQLGDMPHLHGLHVVDLDQFDAKSEAAVLRAPSLAFCRPTIVKVDQRYVRDFKQAVFGALDDHGQLRQMAQFIADYADPTEHNRYPNPYFY